MPFGFMDPGIPDWYRRPGFGGGLLAPQPVGAPASYTGLLSPRWGSGGEALNEAAVQDMEQRTGMAPASAAPNGSPVNPAPTAAVPDPSGVTGGLQRTPQSLGTNPVTQANSPWASLATGLGNASDKLLAFSAGMLSGRNMREGFAAGIEGMQKADALRSAQSLNQNKLLMDQLKLRKEVQGQQATYDALKAAGASEDEAKAGAYGNSPIQSKFLGQRNPVSVAPGATLYDPVNRQEVFKGPKDPDKPEGFDVESKLRGEFGKELKVFKDVHDAYGRVVSAVEERAKNPDIVSPASDMALVFGYMKMLDPGSVVREGEYATASNAASVPERIANLYNKTVKGEFLSAEQRQDMVNLAQSLYGRVRQTAEGAAEQYKGLATQYGVKPDRVVRLPDPLSVPTVGPTRGSDAKPSNSVETAIKAQFPDAVKEGDNWTVVRNGKKHIIRNLG